LKFQAVAEKTANYASGYFILPHPVVADQSMSVPIIFIVVVLVVALLATSAVKSSLKVYLSKSRSGQSKTLLE